MRCLLIAKSVFIPTFLILFLSANTVFAAIGAPVLLWQNGSCQGSFCTTGYYGSVSVADLDNNGSKEVIYAGYRISILDGADGSDILTTGVVHSRAWSSVALADIDNDGTVEILSGHGDGGLYVHDNALVDLWSVNPIGSEVRSLAVQDLDLDGTLEVAVGIATSSATSSWVYEHDGSVRTGWPQLSGGVGFGWGIYGDGIAMGNIDADTNGELVIPTDVSHIGAYEADGSEIAANAMYAGSVWGAVPSFINLADEIQGWGLAGTHRGQFGIGAATLANLDGIGGNEVIVTGRTETVGDPPGSLYTSLFVFNGDRSRYNSGGNDWSVLPVSGGAPLTEDYNVIESVRVSPVAADLDGDGEKEIIYAASDGKVHAMWLDKTEHGNWPYDVADGIDGLLRFASEPVVADLNNDGSAEVIFSSWVEKGSDDWGRLHIVDSLGNMLHEISLPAPPGSSDWSGGMAAPTLAELDGDADLELLINTAAGGVLAYDLPGSDNAHVLWKTGRGNDWRNGTGPIPNCGDGMREGSEECDDGNAVSGDGCSDTCQEESGSDVPANRTPSYELGAASPNPFNPSSAITFRIPSAQFVELAVFDTSGRLINRLVSETRGAGEHTVVWNGRDQSGRLVSSGVYLYRLRAGNFEQTKRFALLK